MVFPLWPPLPSHVLLAEPGSLSISLGITKCSLLQGHQATLCSQDLSREWQSTLCKPGMPSLTRPRLVTWENLAFSSLDLFMNFPA